MREATLIVPAENVTFREPSATEEAPSEYDRPAHAGPYELGAEAGRLWAERLATFEQLDALADEVNAGRAPLFRHGFVDAALTAMEQMGEPVALGEVAAEAVERCGA